MSLLFINKLKEHIVDRSSDKGPQIQELAVDAMQRRLQKVAFTRIFAVKELQQLQVGRGMECRKADKEVRIAAVDYGQDSVQLHEFVLFEA